MRFALLLALAALPLATLANPFPKGDAKAGARLVTEKKCEGCHVRQMGGDGSEIYTRIDRRVTSAQALLQRVAACNAQTNAGLFPEEEEHVAAYLNQKYYKFK